MAADNVEAACPGVVDDDEYCLPAVHGLAYVCPVFSGHVDSHQDVLYGVGCFYQHFL